jgi:VIT1/CCC1 family predicted Fe2+/Mn2+ transporter
MALLDPLTGDVAHIVQLSVAPVFLLSGVATTLSLFTNRLARIVDRARHLEDRCSNDTIDPEMRNRLRVLARRARYINAAIALATVSGVMVAVTVVLLFMRTLTGAHLDAAIAIVFVAAMLALTAALLTFFIEVRLATTTLRIGHPWV